MPELAEVEYFRRQWDAGVGKKVAGVSWHKTARVNRGLNTTKISRLLKGAIFYSSHAAAKQMAFRFSKGIWIGLHLGMTGRLERGDNQRAPTPYDHFVIKMVGGTNLYFVDPRQFGRVQFYQGEGVPDWWAKIAPPILSKDFTVSVVEAFLKRRARAPIKSVLLMQERFPGIGNWMADEVLWRAGFHPAAKAGKLGPIAIKKLTATLKKVCADAMRVIGKDWSDPPSNWLFNHRWSDGGKCPHSKEKLKRTVIGGRTTCWSPTKQKLGAERR